MPKIIQFRPTARKSSSKKWQRVFKNAFRLIFLAILIFTVFFELYYLFTSTSYFEIHKIKVTGNIHMDSQVILKAANVYPGLKIYRLDRKQVADRILKLVWIKKAQVRFESFGELQISVVERKPESVLYADGFFYEVDRDGVILTKGLKNIDKALTIITGINPQREIYEGEVLEDKRYLTALQWIDSLKGSILEDISEINVENESSLYFLTISGVRIYPGNSASFLSYFSAVRNELKLSLKNRSDLDYIDMRYDKEIIYKPIEK